MRRQVQRSHGPRTIRSIPKIDPGEIDKDPVQMARVQRTLVQMGHPVFWYDDVPVGSTGFAAMQIGAARAWWTPDASTLHGRQTCQ